MRDLERLRETTLLELAAIVIKCEILDNLKSDDMFDIVDELVDCRVHELELDDTKIQYTEDVEAFTCELTGNHMYVTKHTTVDSAIKYSVENIGEIHIVYKNDVVIFGGESTDKEIKLRFSGAQYMLNLG